MSYVCLWSPSWPTGAAFPAEIISDLLQHTPRVRVGAGGRVWADARGLDARALAVALVDVAHRHGYSNAHAGAAVTAIAAELAATQRRVPFTIVKPGHDREFVAGFPIDVLEPSTLLDNLLDGIGVETCGALAALDAGHIEVRLGAEGVQALEARARRRSAAAVRLAGARAPQRHGRVGGLRAARRRAVGVRGERAGRHRVRADRRRRTAGARDLARLRARRPHRVRAPHPLGAPHRPARRRGCGSSARRSTASRFPTRSPA